MLIFLTGMMGSGKSTIGKLLAEELQLPFFDTDEIISSIEGLEVKDIFSSKGEPYFRQAEHTLVATWKISSAIVATGGGLPCFHENMKLLNEKGKTVYLKASTDEITERIWQDQSRPLVKGKTKPQVKRTISELMKIRKPYYEQAIIKIKATGTPEEIVKKIIVKLYS
jgi:shikimate kinase